MAIRKCPQCLAVVPVGHAAAFSDTIVCPGCRAPLEVASVSRHVGVWLGLVGGTVGWVVGSGHDQPIGFVLPVLGAVLGYGFVSALVTMLTADLRNRAPESMVEAASASHGSGAAHH